MLLYRGTCWKSLSERDRAFGFFSSLHVSYGSGPPRTIGYMAPPPLSHGVDRAILGQAFTFLIVSFPLIRGSVVPRFFTRRRTPFFFPRFVRHRPRKGALCLDFLALLERRSNDVRGLQWRIFLPLFCKSIGYGWIVPHPPPPYPLSNKPSCSK